MTSAYPLIKSFHGYLGIIASVLLVTVTVLSVIYFFTKKPIPDFFRKIGLLNLISLHTQLILGVLLLIFNSSFMSNFFDYKIQGKVSLMEHIPSNFAVVLLATVFYSILKKRNKVNLVMLLFIFIALILLGRTFMLIHGVVN